MKEKLRKYAKFLLTRCLSIKENEPLVINYLKEQENFLDIVVEEANKMGINDVYVVENDKYKTREILKNSSLEEINNEPYFNRKVVKKVYDNGGSYLYLDSFSDPHLEDIPKEKIEVMNKIKKETQEDAIKARGIYKFPWCIAAVTTDEWAKKLNLKNKNELLDLIFKITLVDNENPIKV